MFGQVTLIEMLIQPRNLNILIKAVAAIKKTFPAAAFILVLLVSSAVVVQPAKSSAKTIVVPDDFSTIQEAVDYASVGDTVFVRAGNYLLTGLLWGLTINKSILLLGENKQNTTLTQMPYRYNEFAIKISADNVTFSGFTVEKGTFGNIAVAGSGCKIMDNNIVNSYGGGIAFGGSKNIVSGNNIIGNRGSGISTSSSDSLVSNNNIANNSEGMGFEFCKNVTIIQNNITENGVGGGLALGWYGPFYIEGNNITYNQGFGIQFGKGTNNATIYKNNVIANQIGFNLLNYITQPLGNVGFGNRVYGNNIVNNTVNANVEYSCIFTANVSEGEGNGTDVVSWDNGIVGNYWSDYDGRGVYVIDQNNVDHYPLMQQVDISSTAPAFVIAPKTENPLLTIAAITIIVSAVVISIGLVVYFKKRKHQVI